MISFLWKKKNVQNCYKHVEFLNGKTLSQKIYTEDSFLWNRLNENTNVNNNIALDYIGSDNNLEIEDQETVENIITEILNPSES